MRFRYCRTCGALMAHDGLGYYCENPDCPAFDTLVAVGM